MVFPSMYDMFIGGVSGTLEPVATTALRELGEELGLGPYGGGGGSGSGPDRGTLSLFFVVVVVKATEAASQWSVRSTCVAGWILMIGLREHDCVGGLVGLSK